MPFKEKFGQSWEVLDPKPTTEREANEVMMAMAHILKPELPAQEAATMMA